MCFSAEVDTNIKSLAKRFQAEIDFTAYSKFETLMSIQKSSHGPDKIKEIFNLKRKSKEFIKIPKDDDERIYPNYFAPIIVMENGKRKIRPMRYRIRPSGSDEEIPSKYNVFNARIDSLETRKTWKNIFMKNHGLFPFKSFYEWVEDKNGKKKLINFIPENKDLIWAPCLFDTWESKDNKIIINSFAVITTDPPPEIKKMGHDRCPIFLLEENINEWLEIKSNSKNRFYDILNMNESVHYSYNWA